MPFLFKLILFLLLAPLFLILILVLFPLLLLLVILSAIFPRRVRVQTFTAGWSPKQASEEKSAAPARDDNVFDVDCTVSPFHHCGRPGKTRSRKIKYLFFEKKFVNPNFSFIL